MPEPALILVAISEETTRRQCELALGANSYRTAFVSDREALEKSMQEAMPDLILLDQDYDGTEGLLVAKGLLERFPTLPILILVRRDPVEMVKRSIAIGIVECLIPPLKSEDILKAVEKSISRAEKTGELSRVEIQGTTSPLQQRIDDLQKYNDILDYLEEGVIIVDEQMNILLINMAVRRAFGVGKDEQVLGKLLVEVISHPDFKILTSGETGKISKISEIVFEDGRVLSAHHAPLPSNGHLFTFQDISSYKHIDRLKNEFASAMSHDLRSPLTAILGYVNLLDRVGPLTSRQRKFVERVQQSVHSITLLADDLMDLGRIESGFDDQKELVNLSEIVREAMEMARGQILQKHLVIGTTFPEKSPILRGNPLRLRQLLDNLIGNAIKYTPAGARCMWQWKRYPTR